MNIKRDLLTILACSMSLHLLAQEKFPFRDPQLPVEQRVEDLVSRLTLEEKVKQMLNSTPPVERLGIPAYNWWNECLHGIGRTKYHVTVFPQAIGMAAAWNDALIKEVASSIADEGRAIYNDTQRKEDYSQYHALTYWTPNINIFRDPRWGRGQETYGEDPYLAGELGKQMILGLQAEGLAATPKHFAVYSIPVGGRDGGTRTDPHVAPREMKTLYLEPFRKGIQEAGALGVMSSYNDYDGEPVSGSYHFLTEILRQQWGFKGYVVSDSEAVEFLHTKHRITPTEEEMAAQVVNAGLNIRTNFTPPQDFILPLRRAISEGKISLHTLDQRVGEILRV